MTSSIQKKDIWYAFAAEALGIPYGKAHKQTKENLKKQLIKIGKPIEPPAPPPKVASLCQTADEDDNEKEEEEVAEIKEKDIDDKEDTYINPKLKEEKQQTQPNTNTKQSSLRKNNNSNSSNKQTTVAATTSDHSQPTTLGQNQLHATISTTTPITTGSTTTPTSMIHSFKNITQVLNTVSIINDGLLSLFQQYNVFRSLETKRNQLINLHKFYKKLESGNKNGYFEDREIEDFKGCFIRVSQEYYEMIQILHHLTNEFQKYIQARETEEQGILTFVDEVLFDTLLSRRLARMNLFSDLASAIKHHQESVSEY